MAILRDVEGLSRFERGEVYARRSSVTSFRGVDTLTGLEVLVYEYAGPPNPQVEKLRSDHLLGLLEQGHENGVTTLVVAYPPGATLVAPGESIVDGEFVLQALEGLRDAHKLGLYHGDIGPSRLLYAAGNVYIEGFGVPWRGKWPQPGTAAQQAALHDVQSLLKTLQELASDYLSSEVKAVMQGALAGSSTPPPTAERLHSLIWRLVGGAVNVPSSGFTDLALPLDPSVDIDLSFPDPPREPTSPSRVQQAQSQAPRPAPQPVRRDEPPPQAARPRPSSPPRPAPQPQPNPRATGGGQQRAAAVDPWLEAPKDPEPITLHSDPGISIPPGSKQKGSSAFVKDLPPGAKYKAGNIEESPRPAPFRVDKDDFRPRSRRSFRGAALLLLLILVAGFAAYLSFVARNPEPVTGGGGGATARVAQIVDVRISPPNMPPVELYVDRSPSGSSIASGTLLGSAPRRYTFDAHGTWVVHAEIQGRRSDSVTFDLPLTSSITLTFPPVGSEGQ